MFFFLQCIGHNKWGTLRAGRVRTRVPPLGLELHPGMQANLVKLFIFLTGMHRGDLRASQENVFSLEKRIYIFLTSKRECHKIFITGFFITQLFPVLLEVVPDWFCIDT